MIALLFAVNVATANPKVDIELALIVDTSGSIDNDLLTAEREILRNALTTTAVKHVIEGNPQQKIAVSYWEFSQFSYQVLPWKIVSNTSIDNWIDRFPQRRKDQGSTNSAQAVKDAYQSMMLNDIDSTEQVIVLLTDAISDNEYIANKVLWSITDNCPKTLSIAVVQLPGNKYAEPLVWDWMHEYVAFGNKRFAVPYSIENVQKLIVDILSIYQV